MKITEEIVRNLVHLLDQYGLIHGAGESRYQFCIQQAVNRVINHDLYGQYSDSPELNCLDPHIRCFGVRLNDCSRDMGEKERASALKRFAVAELGSATIASNQFFRTMRAKFGMNDEFDSQEDIVDDYMHGPYDPELVDPVDRLKRIADTAADTLKEMGTEGSEFLYLIDEPNKEKREKAAHKLAGKKYAANMADFGCDFGCAVKQPPKHKH